MTTKNKISLALLFLSLFLSKVVIGNSDAIERSIQKTTQLQALKHQIEVAKAQVELAKAKKECQKNGGCIEADTSIINIDTTKQNEIEKIISIKQQLNELNALSIDSIINGAVTFENLEGRFRTGDTVFNGVSVIEIDGSKVVLNLESQNQNISKTIFMDWL